MFSGAIFYPLITDLVVDVKKCCGCSVPLHWRGQSSTDLTVCGLTGRNSGPNLQYFAPGNRSHSSGTYRKKSVTMVPEFKKQKSPSLNCLVLWLSMWAYCLALVASNSR